jgi:N-acetylneuraminate synthase
MQNYQKPKIIAEIGCNHKGDLDTAFELIKLAKDSGADIAKFQKRNSKELLTEEQYNAPHPNPINSYGDTYGAHREFLEFDTQENKLLKKYCDEIGIEYSTSVWDVTSAKKMITFQPNFLKVPSACNNHFKMLEVLRDEFEGEVHLSLGMTTIKEEEKIISFFDKNNANDRLVIYSCTSGYPVPFPDVCLMEINRLYGLYENKVKAIAFSGHHLGIAIDIAAYTLGAKYIERHFTKDRTWKGTDHSASLEPTGLKKLVRDLHATYESLNYKKSEILDIEAPQREKLKFRKNLIPL